MAELIKQIIRTQQIIEPQIRLIEQLQKNIIEINRIQEKFIPLVPIKYSGLLKEVVEGALEMNSPSFKSFRKDWGWLVNNKVFTFGDYCYGLYKKQGDKNFKDTINRWFYNKKHLNIVLTDIQEVFSNPRIQVIINGLEFHRKKNYSCSICLLLPQVEGLVWELGVKKDLVKRKYKSKEKKYGSGDWELQELSKKLFPNDKFHKIIVREIFSEGFRNAVLHGRNIHRGHEKEISRWHSTLLILTLWRLSDEF